MVTIKDVAKLAGVSPSTVSRALSGKTFVEPATKKRIMRAVNLLGYTPNSIARGLKEGRTYTIALILPDISNPFYPRIIKSVENIVSRHGISLILTDVDEKNEQEVRAINDMRHRHVDGVIIVPTSHESLYHILAAKMAGVPCVIVNRNYEADIDCVSSDNFYGGYIMTKYLIDHGHTKISALFRNFRHSIYQERYNGCMQALREHGLENCEKYFLFDINTLEDSHRKVYELLRSADRPTAFFVTNDLLAMSVYSAIKSSGFSIPTDISVVGYDNIMIAPYMFPGLTTYEAPVGEIGEWAVQRILKLVEQPTLPSQKVILRGHILERRSVKNLSPSKPMHESIV